MGSPLLGHQRLFAGPLCAHTKLVFSEGRGDHASYLGAERAIPNYNVMGVACALEASVRYLAAELGPEKQVRVNAISAGPIRTSSPRSEAFST